MCGCRSVVKCYWCHCCLVWCRTLYSYLLYPQHEFIKSCDDSTPIRELIAEFKADVIEEEEKLDAEDELKVCFHFHFDAENEVYQLRMQLSMMMS